MRHRVFGNQLGRPTNQAKALYRSLALEVLDHGRIETTHAKAKAVVGLIDRLINFGKRADVAARREIVKTLGSDKLTNKLVVQIAPRFKDRNSGYSRIIKLGKRFSDATEMVYLELVDRGTPGEIVQAVQGPAIKPSKVIEAEVIKEKPVKKVAKKPATKSRKTTKETKTK